MKREKTALLALIALCAVSLAGEAFARGGAGGGQGGGIRMQKRDGSCITNRIKTETKTMTQTKEQARQQLQDGSAVTSGSTRQGGGQGSMRQLGPGDGTGNETRPLDGTGYGYPAK